MFAIIKQSGNLLIVGRVSDFKAKCMSDEGFLARRAVCGLG
jgi:hypothetical protein